MDVLKEDSVADLTADTGDFKHVVLYRMNQDWGTRVAAAPLGVLSVVAPDQRLPPTVGTTSYRSTRF